MLLEDLVWNSGSNKAVNEMLGATSFSEALVH
jgi:hypothetical protein